MRDHGNQVVLRTFIADFVYCLLVLSHVRGGAHAFVPHLMIVVSALLSLGSLGILIYFFHHVSPTIQADNAVAIIGQGLIDCIDGWIETNKHATKAAARLRP